VATADWGEGRTRYEQVSEVARELKTLARDLNITVIALAQVNRSVEQRADKRPGMGDIADSGELEKEADQVVMLYRDDYYNAESPDKGVAELIVEKNRHGATGVIKVGWDSAHMDFYDLANGREARIVRDYESREWA
jgi:replicative DNA helicase